MSTTGKKGFSHALPFGAILEGALYKYKIMKVLGQGSFGITYLANVQMKGKLGTLDSNMTVAIKEFYMRDINGRDGQTVTSGNKGGLFDDYKKKFEREATNLSKLEHPNIVKVLESFEANGTIYYVMEYIDGVSLDKKIEEKKRLDYKTCIKYTKQIGSALAFMHQEHMLHLDVKPANVMLRKSDDAVLIDFGLSKQYDENGEPESSTKVGGGTPGYAPLEQANYHEGKDFPVVMDVYALGGTMFKMFSGCRPPEASDILNEGFPEKDLKVANVPQQLIGCIEKAMNPTKKSRYQTISSFIDAIESAKNELETSEETTVEVSVVDDISDAEAEIVDVQKVDSKTYQVHITNNGLTLSSVHLSDKIYNLKPQKGQLDYDKDYTYQQVLDGLADNITASLNGEIIEVTYRFEVETLTVHFLFQNRENGQAIPFDQVSPIIIEGTKHAKIALSSAIYTFKGLDIYSSPYTLRSYKPDIEIVYPSFSLDNIKDNKINFLVKRLTKEVVSSHRSNSQSDRAIQTVPEHNDNQNRGRNVNGNPNKNRKRITRYYYGIGAIVLLVLVALSWRVIRPTPNDSGQVSQQEQVSYTHSQSIQSSVLSQINGPRLFNNSYYWDGNWEDGKPNGEGVITYLSKDKDGRKEYKGHVSNGLRNDNSAILTYTNGNSFNGSFVNDKLNKGKLILKSDGMYFEGSFKDNQPYDGKWYYTDGSLYSTVTNGIEK